tara:strand:+ start:596 stop:1480 length:885 start_codon:yes stop_codon:yes gene_type:complete
MRVTILIIISFVFIQSCFSDEPNWRVLTVIEQNQPFKALNSIYRKQAVKTFWSENKKVMEEITENWEFLLKSSKNRKWQAYLSRNPAFNDHIKQFVTNWVRHLVTTNKYVQNELSKVDSLAYQKLIQQNSQSERLNEVSNWEEEHKDAFQIIQEFEKEALNNGGFMPSIEKKSLAKRSSKISSKQIKPVQIKRKSTRQIKIKRKQLEKKIRQEKMKTVNDRVSAEINRQAKEFMQSEAMKNGFRGSTAAKNRAFVEQSIRETTLRWSGQDIEKKIRAEIEAEIQAEVKKQISEF